MAKTIKDYQNAYNEAKKKGDKQGMAAAHAGAESIRADKGYSGGVDGSQYISIKKPSSGSSSSKRPGGMSGMLAGMAGAMGNAVSGTLGGKRPSGGSSSSRPSGGSTGAPVRAARAARRQSVRAVCPARLQEWQERLDVRHAVRLAVLRAADLRAARRARCSAAGRL